MEFFKFPSFNPKPKNDEDQKMPKPLNGKQWINPKISAEYQKKVAEEISSENWKKQA